MSEREIFTAALNKQDLAERDAFLDEACAGDSQMRQRVEALLAEHQQLGSFMDAPSPGVTADASSRELPGAVIGAYKLLEQIGEGGMGVVFMAEQQEPVRRKVALKLIKPGMDTRQVIARFEAERQALAVMDHPGIARVLDAGATPSGHPYFVMELVRGVPITTYCDENNLAVRERLELFTSVCQAIQHAHTKGIVHRDIKPTNVMVTQQDGRALVKVIDFGVAKAIGQQLTEKTLFTNFAQIIGTPLYMSPEQAEQGGVDIDTRSDIYSLGVLLYELLTGSTPVDAEQLKQAAFEEIRRIIREDEPQTPSARISGSHTLPAIAARRHIEPARLSKLVRGELDWVVMKALEKDRNRRYETANAFSADLLHYLNDEPVQACQPSAKYRFGKFARRNRVALTTTTLVALSLVVGTVVSTWQAIRAETARKAEVEQRQVAEVARASESEQRKVAETERSKAERQRELAEANFKRARQTVDEYFTLVSESKLFDIPGMQPLRKELLEAALRFYERTAVERTSDPTALVDLAETYIRVSLINHTVDRNDDALAALDRSLDVVDRLRQQFPEARDQHRRLAGKWKGLRPTQASTEMPTDQAAAFKTISRLIRTWDELSREHPEEPAFRSDLAAWYYLLGNLLASGRQPAEGVTYFERARATLQTLAVEVPDNPEFRADLARTHEQLARNLPLVGRQEDADAACREALSLREKLVAEFPQAPHYRTELGTSLQQYSKYLRRRDPIEAAELGRRARDLAESVVRDYPHVSLYRASLARAKEAWLLSRVATGQNEEIEDVLKVLDDAIANCPADPAARDSLAHAIRHVALELPKEEFAAKSTGLHRSSLRLFDELTRDFPNVPGYPEDVGHSSRYLGWIARDAARPDEALEHFDKGVAAFQKCVDIKTPRMDVYYRTYLIDTLLEKVAILTAAGRAEEVEKTSRQAIGLYSALVRENAGDTDLAWKVALAHRTLTELLVRQNRLTEALVEARRAVELAPHDFVVQQCLLDVLTRIGDDEQTLAIFRENATNFSDCGLAHFHFAVVLERAGRDEEALAEYERASTLQRDWEWPHVCQAMIFIRMGRQSEADEAYQKALKLFPRDVNKLNLMAWSFAMCANPKSRNPTWAVQLATKAIELEPANVLLPNTLGVSHYRAGNWHDAIEWLTKSMELRKGGDSFDWFFLGMAHWQLGNKDEAHKWQAKAVKWMDANHSQHHELLRFRSEAEELIKNETKGPDEEQGAAPKTKPSP